MDAITPKFSWTAETVDRLRAMHAEGASASQIAEALGLPGRNPVSGKLKRLGLSGTGPNSNGNRNAAKQTNSTNTAWTTEKLEQLKILHADGATCTQIAAELGDGFSRSAVVSKLRRIGLFSNAKAKKKKLKSLPATARPESVSQEGVIPFSQRCSLMELTDKRCRWPIGDPGDPDFFFCGGQAAEGLPYCAYHSRIAYRPWIEPRRASHWK